MDGSIIINLASSTLLTSCDGIEKIGSFIEIDFNRINRPCICIVTLLFEGVLIGTTRKAPTWCPNPVTVNTTLVLDCNGASDTADVKINDTLVVKAEYQPGQTSVKFYQCLVLRENGKYKYLLLFTEVHMLSDIYHFRMLTVTFNYVQMYILIS